MTSEGASAPIVAAPTVDPNSLEYQAEGNQGHAYQYYTSTPSSVPATWPAHGGEHQSAVIQTAQNVTYQYNQQHPSTAQDGANVPTISSTPAPPGTDNSSHTYSSYPTYPTSTNPYGYSSSDYSSYYSNYQQQPNQTYNQAQGTYQNTGSPYQPISSFPNTGSYAGSTSYPSTYYNPGDYQTTGTYTGSGYSGQSNLWNQGNYPNYPAQYGSYSHDSSGAYGSSNASQTTNYQQHYQQWAEYYSSQTEVTCAPGTENTSVTTTTSLSCPIPGVPSGYGDPGSQPPTSYTPAWKPEDSSTALHSQQTSSTVGAYGDYWKQAYQQPQSNFPNPLDVNSSQPSLQHQPQTLVPQVPYSQYSEVQQSHPHPVQSHPHPVQSMPSTDTLSVNKLQIPSNPRIASNVGVAGSKPIKDVVPPSLTAKPAYVSVSLTKPKNEPLSSSASDSNLKPGVFPASLKGYVERALARCKDEKQRTACQEVMKEIITKATVDGTLHSRDWDVEPLFPLPDTSSVINEQSAIPPVSLSTLKRSPSRRTKSRWEPLPEDKPIEKPISTFQDSTTSTSTYQNSAGHGMWAQFNGRDQKSQLVPGKSERKETTFSRLSSMDQNSASRNSYRPSKRQRFGNGSSVTENGDASSDSDKEQSLTAYYSGAVKLANSPEERKRRENRSKRFEKGNGQKTDNHFRPKSVGVGNLYARRASALVLSKTFEDGGSRAVEDIDWDALTVKGTCQEIEKRYLRLTSAPDPSTVRPEEVLEKALIMVQNSPKNYYYKCDQLKSIRQDLTVQRIRNELTVKVYETHARLALEFGDLPEFNQCQSQLKILYGEGIAGCYMEFSAYNLLSVSLHSNNRRDLLSLMSRLSDEAKKHEAVRHALSVRSAVASGNYVLFFRLYKSAPNLNTCLMDTCVEKVRFEAVKCMSRTYRPTIPILYVAQVLGFSSAPEGEGDDERDLEGLEECTEWLKAHGACLIPDNNGEMMVDAKVSASSLYMPNPEDAVAHGDANLAVNDFLTRALT